MCILLIHWWIHGWTLGCIHVLTIVNKAAIKIPKYIPLRPCFQFFSVFTQKGELLGHVVILFRNFQGATILVYTATVPFYMSTNRTQGPISPHSCQHLVFFFFIMVILVGVNWHATVICIYILLIINDVEHLFIAKDLSFLLYYLYVYCWVVRVLDTFLILYTCHIYYLKIFCPTLQAIFLCYFMIN